MLMITRALSVLLMTLTLGLASPAWADVVLPENEACESAKEGDSCSFEGKSGTCEAAQCCRPGPDGDTCSDCLECVADPDAGGSCSITDLQGGAVPTGMLLCGLVLLLGIRQRSGLER